MLDQTRESLMDRKTNNKCAVCGDWITFKMEPYKDYIPVIHSEVGEVLVHREHLKGE